MQRGLRATSPPPPPSLARVVLASILDGAANFFDAVGSFFDSLAHVRVLPLLAGMAIFTAYLSVRALALRNILRAAYPDQAIDIRQIWGAYIAAYGFNNVVPARGGDVVKLFLVRSSIAGSHYPAVASAFLVAGASEVVAPVRVVDDHAASALARDLHQALDAAGSRDLVTALRDAQVRSFRDGKTGWESFRAFAR